LSLFLRLVTTSLTLESIWVSRIKMPSSSKKWFNECTKKYSRSR
jgi:hypothetical protein